MIRPNKIDWFIYRIFLWWWNPIFAKRPALVMGVIIQASEWLSRNEYED